MSNKLIELLKIEGNEISAAFKKASLQGKGTPQEVADFRENYFNRFIANYFPFPYRVTKATINDSYGEQSDSIDSIIVNPNHPYTIDALNKFSLVLADGVDIAIEIKPDLSTKKELERGLEQIRSVKKLRRRNAPVLATSRHPEHIKEYSRTVPACLFSIKANADPINTGKKIQDYYIQKKVPVLEQVDFVIVNEVGIIANYKYPELSKATTKAIGLHFEKWEDLTLAAFILKINETFPAQIRLSTSILNYYTNLIVPTGFQAI